MACWYSLEYLVHLSLLYLSQYVKKPHLLYPRNEEDKGSQSGEKGEHNISDSGEH